MRIVLGYDGTAGADVAAELVSRLTWPAGSSVHIVHAVETRAASPPDHILSSQPSRLPSQTALAGADEALQNAAKWLGMLPDPEMNVRYGRAASVLAEEATAVGADLIVVGSRGRGPYAALLLGSVSAEVVDVADRAVLVARRTSLDSVVLATDASAPAALAVEAVASWPMFQQADIEILSVADPIRGAPDGVVPSIYSDQTGAHESLEATEARHRAIVADAEARLRAAGRRVTTTVTVGNPAAQVIAAVRGSDADMVVLGSRGHTGLSRAVLGSVAREVLLATEASVLIFGSGL